MKKNILKHNQQPKNTIKEVSLTTDNNKKWLYIYISIAFIVPVLLYLQTITFGLTHFDDMLLITQNINFLSDFGNAKHVFITSAFIGKLSQLYRPLQTLSYMIDIQLSGGDNVWMYHLTNVLLLGAISGTLFLLLRKFLIPSTLALAATLIYCVNPLFVSSIAWIPARGDLQLTLFSLLSFLFLIDFFQKGKIKYLLLNWAAFTFALFSKETAALLPFLFIIYYFAFQSSKRFDKKYIYLVMLYAVSGIIWFILRSKAIEGIENLNKVPVYVAILANIRTIPESIFKFLVPYDINPLPILSIFKSISGFIIITLIIIIVLKNKEKRLKEIVFCFSWFLILMLPPMFVKNLFIDYLDHRFFLPLIGLLLFLLFIIPKKWFAKRDIKRYWILGIIFILFSSFTVIKSRYYTNPITFYNTAISQNPKCVIAYFNRGNFKNEIGDSKGAIEDYNKAIANDSNYADAYNNRGNLKNSLNDSYEAIKDFNYAISIRPNYADAYNNRGVAKANTGDNIGAINDYNKAININPNNEEAYNNRGAAKANTGDNIGAIDDYNKAITLNPKYADAYYNRSVAKDNIGDKTGAADDQNKAIAINPKIANKNNNIKTEKTQSSKTNPNATIDEYNKAIANNPKDADAYYYRGAAKVVNGDNSGAIEDYDKAVSIRSNYAEAYYNRGIAKTNIGNNRGAIEDYNKAIAIRPYFTEAYNNKGVLINSTGNYKEALISFNKAIEINPNYLSAYINRAFTKYKLKDYAGANEDCDKALIINTNSKNAQNLKAQIQQELQKKN